MSDALAEFQNLLTPDNLPELGPGPRRGVLSLAALNQLLDQLFAQSKLSPSVRELTHSLILLWHDHMDAAHTLCQDIENPDGSFVHGILHRREPDYSNAAYWFRRVGQHPAFPAISERVTEFLHTANQPALLSKLVSNGQWSPFAFIDECQKVSHRSANDSSVEILRKIQALESQVLLEYFLKS